MSRALTVYSRPKEPNEAVERVMEQMGCSEPVARNMLKSAKLGVGPLANMSNGAGKDRRPPPPSRQFSEFPPPAVDKKRAALRAEQRLREAEDEAGADVDETMGFLASGIKRKVKPEQKIMASVGMARLGPVETRHEEMDPFPLLGKEAVKKDDDDDEDEGRELSRASSSHPSEKVRRSERRTGRAERVQDLEDGDVYRGSVLRQPAERMTANADDDRSKRKRRDRDRRLDEFDRGFEEVDGAYRRQRERSISPEWDKGTRAHRDPSMTKAPRREKKQLVSESTQNSKERAPRQDKMRSPSVSSEEERMGGATMSEAQVKKMMSKDKKKQVTRGSVAAAQRIKRESEEWEARKKANPQYWQAPKFALCFKAKT